MLNTFEISNPFSVYLNLANTLKIFRKNLSTHTLNAHTMHTVWPNKTHFFRKPNQKAVLSSAFKHLENEFGVSPFKKLVFSHFLFQNFCRKHKNELPVIVMCCGSVSIHRLGA